MLEEHFSTYVAIWSCGYIPLSTVRFFSLVHCLCLHYRLADVRYMLSACDLLLTLLSYVNSEFFPQTLLVLKLHTSIVVFQRVIMWLSIAVQNDALYSEMLLSYSALLPKITKDIIWRRRVYLNDRYKVATGLP